MQELIRLIPGNSSSVCEIDLFGLKGLSNAIKKLHWKKKGEKLYDSKGKPILCSICHTQIDKKNLAAFFPGTVKQVCSKPGCFIAAIHESKKYEK